MGGTAEESRGLQIMGRDCMYDLGVTDISWTVLVTGKKYLTIG